jgi:hypothetical protein
MDSEQEQHHATIGPTNSPELPSTEQLQEQLQNQIIASMFEMLDRSLIHAFKVCQYIEDTSTQDKFRSCFLECSVQIDDIRRLYVDLVGKEATNNRIAEIYNGIFPKASAIDQAPGKPLPLHVATDLKIEETVFHYTGIMAQLYQRNRQLLENYEGYFSPQFTENLDLLKEARKMLVSFIGEDQAFVISRDLYWNIFKTGSCFFVLKPE